MSANQTSGSRPTRQQRRERARDERRAKEAAQRRSAAARRRLKLVGGVAIALLAVAVAVLVALRQDGAGARAGEALGKSQPRLVPLASLGALRAPGAAGPLGPEQVPIPVAPPAASTASKAAGEPVDGIECSSSEQTLFHVHAHLTIFVNGAARRVPYGIGIPDARVEQTQAGPFVSSGSCFYWLHTHAEDGIVHIESPTQRTYDLGNFFDIWGQPLSPTQVGPATGRVTALYDGERYEGDPRMIPLTPHAQIQLDVRRPLVAPEAIEFPSGL
jgi:hypothetical protein